MLIVFLCGMYKHAKEPVSSDISLEEALKWHEETKLIGWRLCRIKYKDIDWKDNDDSKIAY